MEDGSGRNRPAANRLCRAEHQPFLNNEEILLWKQCDTLYYQDANQSKNFETTDGSGPLTSLLSDQAPPPD
jgi:hypothetical protein